MKRPSADKLEQSIQSELPLELALTTITALLAVYVSLIAFLFARKTTANQNLMSSVNQWQQTNLAILADDKLLEIEAKNHPFENLGTDDARKMYLYFCALNVAASAEEALHAGVISQLHANAYMNNVANILYQDQEFVRLNCFPRGYPVLELEMTKRWKIIDERGEQPIPIGELLTQRKSRPWSLFFG